MNRHPRPEIVPAVLVTIGLLLSGCADSSNSGGAATSTSPSASISSDPPESETSGEAPPHLAEGGAVAPGTYQFTVLENAGVDTPDALVQVPSGFDSGGFYVVSHDGHEFLGLWTVGNVERDACLRPLNDIVVPGPSVEDLADALVAQKSTRASAPESVTLAGYQGLYVELAGPRDLSRCDQAPGLWGDPGGRCICSDGQVDLVWILDVNGQRLVVNAAYSAPSDASDIDKLTSMVESLEFVAASS